MLPFKLNEFLVELAKVKLVSKNALTEECMHLVWKTTWVSKVFKTSVSLTVCIRRLKTFPKDLGKDTAYSNQCPRTQVNLSAKGTPSFKAGIQKEADMEVTISPTCL